MDTYSSVQMLQALESLDRTPRFLLDFFFPGVVTFDTSEVKFDKLGDNMTLAPFVSPLVAGKAEKGRGFTTDTFKPAYVKPKNMLDPERPLIRMPGEAIGGSLSAGDRRILLLNQLMVDQREQIVRRLEWMAASALTTGKVTVSGDDYKSTVVDFGRTGTHSKTLTTTDRWGESGVSPYDDIDSWCDTVAAAAGAGVDAVVMGKDAWGYLRADEKFDKALDRRYGQNGLIELGYQTGQPGVPQYKGTIGDLSFYTYNGQYKDSSGAKQNLLDPKGVILAARGALAGVQAFGAILDGKAGYQQAQWWPKHWIEKDPSVEFVMTQSAPLIVPRRADASMYVKVR